ALIISRNNATVRSPLTVAFEPGPLSVSVLEDTIGKLLHHFLLFGRKIGQAPNRAIPGTSQAQYD
ncbi:MAG: hypothetical protein AAF299_22055, partial [Pseudomonadota bacterium]